MASSTSKRTSRNATRVAIDGSISFGDIQDRLGRCVRDVDSGEPPKAGW